MKQGNAEHQTLCPRVEIAAYVDGELTPREELVLEQHLAVCPTCAAELNEQKRLLCVLDSALENKDEIELPANFTKVIVANAESKVSGLRSPHERSRALFVCCALFLLVMVGLGAESSKTFAVFGSIADRFLAVGFFLAHLVQDITFGIVVILRSLCLQLVFKSVATVVFLGIFFFLALLTLSRLITRQNRL